MQKTILITGSTDGIGLAAACKLAHFGHRVLLHGRNATKLARAVEQLSTEPENGTIETFLADLSKMQEVKALADAVADKHDRIDVLINNAGIFRTSKPRTDDGLDVRFAVNTIAPLSAHPAADATALCNRKNSSSGDQPLIRSPGTG